MAGICGIIQKAQGSGKAENCSGIEKMLEKLSSGPHQHGRMHSEKSISLAFSASSAGGYSRLIIKDDSPLLCLIEGIVLIEQAIRDRIKSDNPDLMFLDDFEYVPYLFAQYKENFAEHLGGWFNIFIYDRHTGKSILANDRFGFLPLFIFESAGMLVFSSKLESILAGGIAGFEPDPVSIAEQIMFNYPLSENTLVKNVRTLPAATVLVQSRASLSSKTYWHPSDLISNKVLKETESVDLINESLGKAVRRLYNLHGSKTAVSLTGGWDGRLVLAYLLNNHRNDLNIYSFGSASSPDITIPSDIASAENINKHSIILNQEFLDESFEASAHNTILSSNGMRSYRRAPYMFAMEKLSGKFSSVLSGNFGDEVLKYAMIKPSAVISGKLIQLIQELFKNVPAFPSHIFSPGFMEDRSPGDIKDEWNMRMNLLRDELSIYTSGSQQMAHIKYTRIANRYFGYEVNSYNDYVENYSPFLDYDFIRTFSSTSFSGINHPFNSNSLRDKEKTSRLYATLIKMNSGSLAKYQTDRGYSINNITGIWSKGLILYRKTLGKKQVSADPYYLNNAATIFDRMRQSFGIIKPAFSDTVRSYTSADNIVSLEYWLNYMNREYLK